MFSQLFSEYIQKCIQALETTEDDLLREDMKSIKATLGDAYEYELSRFIHVYTLSGFGGAIDEEDEHDKLAEVIHHLARHYKQMCKIYTFRVAVKGQEKNVWRDLQMPAQASLEALGYAVMASMNCDGSHLFNITYKRDTYVCNAADISFDALPASEVMLGELNFNKRSKLVMEYDFGESYQFDIKVTRIQTTKTMPYDDVIQILDGQGYGILEDAHYIFDAYFAGDKEAVSEYLYDYDEEMDEFDLAQSFDLEECNDLLLTKMEAFKVAYEMDDEFEEDEDFDFDEDDEFDEDPFTFA